MRRVLIRVLVIAGFIVVCFVGGILLVNFVMSYMVGRGDEAVVPDLHGMDIVEARRMVQEQDLTLAIADQRYSDEMPTDAILQQVPLPGRKMKRTREIQVTTSLGPELARVPDLRGVAYTEALERLRSEGLEAGDVSRAHVADVEKDAVALSRPRPGESVKKGTVVSLLVSDGPEPAAWVMPDLRGKSENRARATLSDLGIVPEVTRSREKGAKPGTVIRQDPGPGEKVLEGDRVDLVVAP